MEEKKEKKKKSRISITIDEDMAEEIEQYYRDKVKTALENKAETIPKLSNTYEEIIKNGWELLKKK